MVRVKPITEENREMSEKCASGLAYQGNNILCSDWDADHMEHLDYNGMYEYLYAMKYQEQFPSEITDIRENKDRTVTLAVDAVCSMVLCDDAVITHELTVRFSEDGGFQYLGNKIPDDGISNIPEYQYRIVRE